MIKIFQLPVPGCYCPDQLLALNLITSYPTTV